MKSSLFDPKNERIFCLVFFIAVSLGIAFQTGCGGGENANEVPVVTSRKIFVTNAGGHTVSVFDAEDEGNIVPVRTIGSNTGLASPMGVFVDTEHDEIFVANADTDTITVYLRTAEGNASPVRIIGGPDTGLATPCGIFVDTENDEIFVVNLDERGTITLYGRTARGNIAPSRTLAADPDETFETSFTGGIFVENDEIFVTGSVFDEEMGINVGTILIYSRENNDNSPPLRTISIPELTDEGQPFTPRDVYADAVNRELFVVDADTALVGIIGGAGGEANPFPIQTPFESAVRVYDIAAADTEGGLGEKVIPLPLRTIKGANARLSNPVGISVDAERNEIFVVNSFNNTVTVYGRTDRDDDEPIRTISIPDLNNAGRLKGRFLSAGLFIDKVNKEVFVANINDTITVHRITDDGEDDLPKRFIGSDTGILEPNGISVDTEDEEIFVSNFFSSLITVYGITDEGNVSPLRIISQGSLVSNGIYMDSERDEVFVANSGEINAVTVYGARDGERKKSIFGQNTGLIFPRGLYLDEASNELFVADSVNTFDLEVNAIRIYEGTDEGDVLPVDVIEGEATGLLRPRGVFADANSVYVTNLGMDGLDPQDDKVTIYNRTPDLPLYGTIQNPDAKLDRPFGIFVDAVNDEIFVANSGNNTITVYDRNTLTLKRTIGGLDTGLSEPCGIFVIESP